MLTSLVLLAALTATPAQDRVLDAIRYVESGNRANVPDGDAGRAIGPFQIWRSYYTDSRIPGDYARCREQDYARRVVEAYMRRYEPRAWANADAQTLARLHNAGPGWRRNRKATDGYWAKVKAALTRKGNR
jgi:hypothetical protein